ncbi:hypothetical protein [Streptomyces sp. NPDC058891]|uniref:hypothetical protein n=1 Tax=Streptomyces sp. NPDC058891 TaxID=3346667 RepID=UPI003689A7AE
MLLYLFNSKEGLIRALLARALSDETLVMDQARAGNERAALQTVARELWRWLSADSHRGVLALWALDLLATGDLARTTAAVHLQLDSPA